MNTTESGTDRLPQTRRIEVLLGRSAFYHGLSLLLRRPDAQILKWLAMGEHHRLSEIVPLVAAGGGEPLAEPVRRLIGEMDSTAAAEWIKAQERLFGHSVRGAAPPYELEYGQEHEHQQPQHLSDIAAFYQAFGLRISAEARERADHAVAECEFLQFLLYKQACALDEGRQEQAQICEEAARRFLREHLGRWGPAFCLRLSRAAGGGILGAIADLLLTWLLEECRRMGVPAGSFDLPLRLPREESGMDCTGCPSAG